MAQTFFVDEEIGSQLRLDAIVTLADAAHVLDHLEEVKPEGVENEAVEQVAFADRIILNKTDLADSTHLAHVRGRLRAINALAGIIPAAHAAVELGQILDVGAFDLARALDQDPLFLTGTDHQHDQTVTSVGIELPGEIDAGRLNDWLGVLLASKGTDIFRSKGILALAGSDRQHVFQGVHMLFDSADGRPWRDGEPRANRMIFIGRNLDRAELERGFTACLAGVPA